MLFALFFLFIACCTRRKSQALLWALSRVEESRKAGNTVLLIKGNILCNSFQKGRAEVNAVDERGLFPLQYALMYMYEDCASLLLDFGSRIDCRDDQGTIFTACPALYHV